MLYSGLNEPTGYVHGNVVEVYAIGSNKHYKCLDCGHEWTAGLSSATVKTDEEVKDIYSDYPLCKDL